ncbi:MAG: hypothetical protein ACXWQZ_20880, partial [Ktedonobacterales bacterium]
MQRMTRDGQPRQWRDWDDFDPDDMPMTRAPRRGRAPRATTRGRTGGRRSIVRLLALNVLLICLVGAAVLGGLYAHGHGWAPQTLFQGKAKPTAAATPAFVRLQNGRIDRVDT